MSISTTVRKAGPYAGNNVQVAFPFSFKVFSDEDLLVVRTAANGAETVLVLDTDYSAVLNADQDGNPGGVVTLGSALATGTKLTITSDLPAVQGVALTNGGGFFPEVINGALDYQTILSQQLAERQGRVFSAPISYTGSFDVPVVPNGVLSWNGDGSSLIVVTLPDLSLILALPNQAGHNGHALYSNGTTALWRATAMSDVTGLTAALANVPQANVTGLTTALNNLAAADSALAARVSALESRANFAANAAVLL